jgi:hypothetical protein
MKRSEIAVVFSPQLPSSLLRLFQKGLEIEVDLGTDLVTLLRSDLCLTEEGIDRIQTIFWQGKPVDDLHNCRTVQGGILALSAALPGLVGACLRRGGAWAPLRSSITHDQGEAEESPSTGTIIVKLFNFMLREVGPMLLARGIILNGKELSVLLTDPEVSPQVHEMRIDDELVAPGTWSLTDTPVALCCTVKG